MRKKDTLAVLVVGLLFGFAARAQEYTFAIVPQLAPAKMAQTWGPLLDRVSKESGVKLKFVTAPSISEFEERLVLSGKADFLWSNPLTYVKAAERHGYTAFAREAKNTLKGILVVRTDSPVAKLADMKAKKLAVPLGAFAAETLTQADLARAGVPPENLELKIVGTHDSAYLMVLSGQADAAGGVMRTFKNLPADSQAKLRILHTTDAVTPHPFSANTRVPPEVVARVKAALIKVGKDPASAEILAGLKFGDGFEQAADGDYADARKVQAVLGEHQPARSAK